MSPPRVGLPFGRVIDRTRPIMFSFEGKRYGGFAGDTLASALLANGVRTIARSFKYRRPRGIFGHGDFDAHALVQVGDEPNVPADRLLLRDDLPPVEAQNRRGSVSRDLGAWSGLSRAVHAGRLLLSHLLSAARRLAQVRADPAQAGRAGQARQGFASCRHRQEVSLLRRRRDRRRSGGIAAARAAADAGADVLLVEAAPRLGGFALAMPEGIWPEAAAAAEPSRHHPADRRRRARTLRRWMDLDRERKPLLQGPGQGGGSGYRRDRATAHLPQQRVAGGHAGVGGAPAGLALRRQSRTPRGRGDGERSRSRGGARFAAGRRRDCSGRRSQAGNRPQRSARGAERDGRGDSFFSGAV